MPQGLSSLAPFERDLLFVLALSPSPLPRNSWFERIRVASPKGQAAAGLSFVGLNAVIDRLVSSEWVSVIKGQSEWYLIPESLAVEVLFDARDRGRTAELTAPFLPTNAYGWADLTSLLRLAVVREDAQLLSTVALRWGWTAETKWSAANTVRALTNDAPEEWLAQLPMALRLDYLSNVLQGAGAVLTPVSEGVLLAAARETDHGVRGAAALALAFKGEGERAFELLAGLNDSAWVSGARGVLLMTLGRWGEAREAFDAVSLTRQGKRKQRALPALMAVFDLLLVASPVAPIAGAGALMPHVEVGKTSIKQWPDAIEAVVALATFRISGRQQTLDRLSSSSPWPEAFLVALAARWMGIRMKSAEPCLASWQEKAASGGYHWLARQFAAMLGDDNADPTALASLTSKRPPWEVALSAMATAFERETLPGSANTDVAELYWTVAPAGGGANEGEELLWVLLTPRLVKRQVGKVRQAGQILSLAKVTAEAGVTLTPDDRVLVDALVEARRDHHGTSVSVRELVRAVGHPRLRDEEGNPLRLERGETELRVRAEGGGMRIEVHPSVSPESSVVGLRGDRRITLYERSGSVARLLGVLGTHGLYVPSSGLTQVTETISRIAPHVPVRGVELLGESAGATAVPADGRLRVQLFPSGASFRVRLRVKPGGDDGPLLRPGIEPKHVLLATELGARSFVRDLEAEKLLVERLLANAPYFATLRSDGDDRVADDLETCLSLVTELGPLADDSLLLEWPEGGKLRAPGARDEKSMRVRVGGTSQWLSVSADVVVDEGRVLSMAFLLDSVSRAAGRFVPIGEGEYLALSAKLREQIDAFARVQELADKRGHTSLAALPAIAQWADGANVSYDDGMDHRLAELSKALDGEHRVPRSLEAELRDYQIDGFVFLARRAASGFGACLADDMGLGKTVQALALILSRASKGPSLVVAPTSVCRNWENEARKFAPSLSFIRFGEAADRQACLDGLGPRDVLVCSYGLLAPAEKLIGSRIFRTVVFDEAHALKNADTRRAAAARAIRADAIVALSGTPLENHLGELHSLFDLLAPGLLGSRERFERAFAVPISRGDRRAMAHLRTLVRPFILRRTKAQVLTELPPKTEITRTLTPTAAERDFYEALRRTAIKKIESAAKERGAQARIEVLAEITKLRRAAIDPRLVAGDSAPAGSKIDALADLVVELRDEGHPALVFSQFLEVLDRAAAKLDERGVRHVRLDGSMNAAARALAVETFQSGQADVFLLSLKAGGVGMNLTAADYVIHVDPWWNPAVEDQATDRAHRIGQTRPVTVVRLVTEGTIEEKVLALHASKRALYEDALSDMAVAKKLDVHALLDLLREDTPPPEGRAPRKPGRPADVPPASAND